MPGGANPGAYMDSRELGAGAVGGDEARAGHWPVSKFAIHIFNTQSSCGKAVWSHRFCGRGSRYTCCGKWRNSANGEDGASGFAESATASAG